MIGHDPYLYACNAQRRRANHAESVAAARATGIDALRRACQDLKDALRRERAAHLDTSRRADRLAASLQAARARIAALEAR